MCVSPQFPGSRKYFGGTEQCNNYVVYFVLIQIDKACLVELTLEVDLTVFLSVYACLPPKYREECRWSGWCSAGCFTRIFGTDFLLV